MDSRRVPPPPAFYLPSLAGSSVRRGVWSAEEHDRFLQALKRFPDGPWQQLALCVGTRSTRQVQTHAQKFFEKIRRRQRGLLRSYVGLAREHRVDNDVVAILSSVRAPDYGDDDDNDQGDIRHEDEDDEEDEDGSEEGDDSGHEEGQKDGGSIDGGATSTTFSRKRPRSAGKQRRSTSAQSSKSPTSTAAVAEEPPPTLPRRIHIRRSARSALRIAAANRDQLVVETTRFATAARHEDASTTVTRAETVTKIDPVEPTRTDLPSIEEALDFFLHSIDGESRQRTTHSHRFTTRL